MLIEIWERLRGYDKWIETQAAVDSATAIRKMLGERFQESPESRSSGRLLYWKDQYSRIQCGAFVTHDISPFINCLTAKQSRFATTPQSRIAITAARIG